MTRIQVLIYEPGKPQGELRSIGNELNAFQEIVGGYIEVVPLGELTLVINEEGLLRGLRPNRGSLVGTFFVTRTEGEEFDTLKPEDIVLARKLLDDFRFPMI